LDVKLNWPFAGGYLTRTHGANPIPWIQVEMSRELYLRAPYLDRETWKIDPARLRDLNSRFLTALELLFARLRK
jgi:formiminoglutamase